MAGEELASLTGSDALLGPLLGIFAAFFVVFLIMAIATYIYSALALMAIAKRTKTPNEWLAWIPVGNIVLMANIAKMHWWPVLLLIAVFIPFIGVLAGIALAVFVTMWLWKICEARGKPGWWAILTLIPIAGSIWAIIMLGILAWGE